MCILNRVAPRAASTSVSLKALKAAHRSATPATQFLSSLAAPRRMLHTTVIRAADAPYAARATLPPLSGDDASIPVPVSIMSEQSRAAFIAKFKLAQEGKKANTKPNQNKEKKSYFIEHYWDPAVIPLVFVFGVSCLYLLVIGVRHSLAPDVHFDKSDRSSLLIDDEFDRATGESRNKAFTYNFARQIFNRYDAYRQQQVQDFIKGDKTQ